MHLRLLALCLAFAAALGLPCAAWAGCTASSTSLTFAASSSYDVQAGTIAQVSGSAGLACTGAALSLLGGSTAKATVTSANGFRLLSGTGDVMPYQVSADSGGTQVFTQGKTIDYMSPTLLSLLGIGGASNFSAPLYAKLTASPNIAAGTYTDTLTVNWNYNICNGIQIGQLCVLYETGTPSITVTITVVIGADCRITAPNVAFGTAALVSQFSAVSQSVLVDCTKGSAYKVAFSAGQAGSARPWRAMTDGAGHSLQYNLYRPDGTTIWDTTNPLQSATAGTGSATPSQVQSYVAKVNPAQITPPAGSYSDTVSVILSF